MAVSERGIGILALSTFSARMVAVGIVNSALGMTAVRIINSPVRILALCSLATRISVAWAGVGGLWLSTCLFQDERSHCADVGLFSGC